jgi:hypothetical protein
VEAPLEVVAVACHLSTQLRLAIRGERSLLVQTLLLRLASFSISTSSEMLAQLLLLAVLGMDHHPERGLYSQKNSGSLKLRCSIVQLEMRLLDLEILQEVHAVPKAQAMPLFPLAPERSGTLTSPSVHPTLIGTPMVDL